MKDAWMIIVAAALWSSAATAQDGPEFRQYRVPSASLIEDLANPGLEATDPNEVRPLVPIALDLIKHFEGWYASAYDDPVGYCTIGYGHLIAYKACADIDLGDLAVELTEKAGTALLEADTLTSRLAVQESATVDLTHEQFGALTSFVFNVGKTHFTKSTLLRLLNRGEYDLAADQFARWIRAGETVLPGLVARRACEETLFRGHLQYDKHGEFNRAACVSLGAADAAGPLIDVLVGE